VIGCKENKTNASEKSESASKSNESVLSPNLGNIESDKNVAYFEFKGFDTRMPLPEVWQNNVSIEKTEKPNADCLAEYEIFYDNKEKNIHSPLGAIYIFSENQWKSVPENEKGIYVQVGNINNNIYTYVSVQSNPFDPQSENGKAFESHVIFMNRATHFITIEK
jgi:hypothetical protein